MAVKARVTDFRRVSGASLRANQLNFRKHPAAQRAALRGVVDQVGIAGALLAYEHPEHGLTLIDGHLRAEDYGEVEWPVVVLDVSEAEANVLLATHDPIAEMAEADAATLDSLLRQVQTDSDDVAKMLDKLAKDAGCEWAKAQEITEDEVPEAPANPVSKTGDMWLLGEHRLLCGDSTKAEDVGRMFNGTRAMLLFTSPPYAQQRDYGAAKSQVQDWDSLMSGVFAQCDSAMELDGQILVNLGLVHRDGEWWPYWDNWIAWMRNKGWRRFGWYVWDQGSGLPGDWNGRLAPSHEFVFHFNRQPAAPQKWIEKKAENIKRRNTGERTMRGKDGKTKKFTNESTSSQPTKIPDSVLRINRQVGSNGHPAQFPVAFAAGMLRTWPGLAYEPFSGSGTTLIASEQLGRRCYAIELDPAYCDIAIERWEKLTGGKAQRG